jgi:hypothetical protein
MSDDHDDPSDREVVDWTSLRVDLRTMISVLVFVGSMTALYFGLSAKIDLQSQAIEEQRKQIAVLSAKLDTAEQANRAHERALIELTVTLRTKGVIR